MRELAAVLVFCVLPGWAVAMTWAMLCYRRRLREADFELDCATAGLNGTITDLTIDFNDTLELIKAARPSDAELVRVLSNKQYAIADPERFFRENPPIELAQM